ncbi:MAG: AarF/UbiB family protein [Moraxellaceae bacterium]|nr:AarF/UbiB family protein [Moraxellaceae bacterium]
MMLVHLPRLLAIWTVIARYRLDTLLPPPPGLRGHVLLALIRLHPLWWVAGARARHPARLRQAFEELGPLFIKLGQLLSTRRDLLPAVILDELEKLQDQVPPFPSRIAISLVETELRAPLGEKFSRFDEVPLAAASIAQVHTAALPDGREVVVKILRPGVAAQIRQDMALLRDLTAWLEARFPDLAQFHPHRIARDYEQTLLDETDLLREAANTRQMRQNFLNSPLLYVPEIHDDWCTAQVMVAERIYGVPVDDHASFERLGINRQQLAETGFTIFFTQLLRHNFFHADMHPGNVFVETPRAETSAASGKPARYIALDIAIVGQLAREDQLTVARLALALIQRDYAEIIRTAHRSGWLPPGANLNQLAGEVQRIAAPVLEKPIDQIQFGPTLLALLDMARTHHLEIPVQLVLLIKTLVHVEGLGRSLYPALDIWALGRPLLTQWLNEQIGPAALIKRMSEQAPALITGLPDLPDLVLDALTQMRQTGQWQERQSRELQALRQQLHTSRRHDFLALAGIGGGIAAAVWLTGTLAVLGGIAAAGTLLWRVSNA